MNKEILTFYPSFIITIDDVLTLEQMNEVDNYAINQLQIPLELMKENAGTQFANLISNLSGNDNKNIQFGIGPGNNGGGGLVAAQKLAKMGFNVFLDIPQDLVTDLSLKLLEKALKAGCEQSNIQSPDIFVDAYFGFSQRLPLPLIFRERIKRINEMDSLIVSLDIPTGLVNQNKPEYIKPKIIATLAAPLKILFQTNLNADIYLLDIGIPQEAIAKQELQITIPFGKSKIYKLEFNKI